MFKSIQYKLYILTALLIISVVLVTYCILSQEYIYAIVAGIFFLVSLSLLSKNYRKFNQNILFLLNALDNGDYSFHFTETKLSRREKELNMMLNRIKDILVKARKEVIENEKFLSLIVESVSTGIIIIDDRGIVHRVNQSALTLLGLPILTHINQLNTINDTYPALIGNLKPGEQAQISILNEREELQISITLSAIKLNRGIMRVLTLHNIGNELESKEMESWIKLIRVMTHEIMNSIAPITSLSETMLTLMENNNTPVQAADPDSLKKNTVEAFETINTTAKGLLAFVESYRRFTSIPQPEKKHFTLHKLIQSTIKLYDTAVAEKGICLKFIPYSEEITINADEKLIHQVLLNLMKNAIEAIDKEDAVKEIIIQTKIHDDKRITVDVANTGNLIPANILPHIFIPFFTTKQHGSGIGLSVSRYIMRLHGGKLQHLVSKEGMTVFQLSINDEN